MSRDSAYAVVRRTFHSSCLLLAVKLVWGRLAFVEVRVFEQAAVTTWQVVSSAFDCEWLPMHCEW